MLLTVFSLSNYNSKEELVKTCFSFWIKKERGIDQTVNQYEAALLRLSDAFLRIVDVRGQRMIGAANPSINDYLGWRMTNSPAERKFVLDNACSIQQYCKLLSEQELLDFAEELIRSGSDNSNLFADTDQRNAFIAWCIGQRGLKDARYKREIWEYISTPRSLSIDGSLYIDLVRILKCLMTPSLVSFYQLVSMFDKFDQMDWERVIGSWSLERVVEIVSCLSPIVGKGNRGEFVQCASIAVQDAVDDFCDEIDAADYYPDVGRAVKTSTYGEDDFEVDEAYAARLVEEAVEQKATEEIEEILAQLPQDIRNAKKYLEDVKIDVSGADEMIEAYLADEETNRDSEEELPSPEENEIDLMFER